VGGRLTSLRDLPAAIASLAVEEGERPAIWLDMAPSGR